MIIPGSWSMGFSPRPSGGTMPSNRVKGLAAESSIAAKKPQTTASVATATAWSVPSSRRKPMTAMTLYALSGGRFILGLGPSGPQVVEGWHGVAYGRPLTRTKEYISIIRKILAREERVTLDTVYGGERIHPDNGFVCSLIGTGSIKTGKSGCFIFQRCSKHCIL